MSDSSLAAADTAVSLLGVRKTFGAQRAVDDLDLLIPRGALYGFIGPNGAGKTTTIRMIMSILFPDAGRLSVLGRASALEAKDRIGYLPEERGLYRKMRVGEMLSYLARLKGASRTGLALRIRTALERLDLGNAENKRCDELSKGMLQKVQFIGATLHEPDLLILDEPFSGLDPVSTRLLKDLVIEEHRRGATVLFSTHVMPQAEEICRHIIMIHRGRKVLDADIASIQSRYDARRVNFAPLDPEADLESLAALPEVARVERTNAGADIVLAEGAAPAEAMRRIVGAIPPARIELARPRLEDIFIDIVAAGDEGLQAALRAGAALPEGEGATA
ncbi:MAG TPA: ATP-binding cassette domain-containing protein [Gammaproteobacteria bacterium]|nr:ATP-binding cassette domain-containing protein [Gammaproteobacteria bacterium]